MLREDLLESLDVHQEITQDLHEEETLRIGGKWKAAASEEASLSAGSEAGRYLVNQKASQSDWDTGEQRGNAR